MSPHEQRLLPLAQKPPGQLLIHEIYRSIQGESTFAGLPCVSVRSAVCGQRCIWCDTPHAFDEGTTITSEGVSRHVDALTCPVVEVTGSRPLLEAPVPPLLS